MGEEEKNLKMQYVIFKCVQFPNVKEDKMLLSKNTGMHWKAW